MIDEPYFVVTAIADPGEYDRETRAFGHEVDVSEHAALPDALEAWERVAVDLAWTARVACWHATVDGRRLLVADSTIGRDRAAGLTRYGAALVAAIDAPPVAYRVLPDPAGIVQGEHNFIARRLGPGMDAMLRCSLTIGDDGAWQAAVQPVTATGQPAGPAMVVYGTELDPAATVLAVIAGAAPLPDRPIGMQAN